jgi:hypothetical protein
MSKNINNPDTHPKIYISLDKKEIEDLKEKAKQYIKENNRQKAEGILEAIDWIDKHNIYTRY